MSEKTYYENAGKGDHRRKEDTKRIEKNWDAIDWSVKASSTKVELCRCCHNERGMWENGQWVECPACKE